MLRRLLLAKERGFRKLRVNVDSANVVGLLQGSMMCNVRYYTIVERCKELYTSSDWEIVFTPCYREANQVVDALANLGVELACDFVLFNAPSREVLTSLYADQVGVKYPRLVANQ